MGWLFGKSQAELDREIAAKKAMEAKVIDDRIAAQKTKGEKENPGFKAFDEVFAPGQSHRVEKEQNKIKLEASRKSPFQPFATKPVEKVAPKSIFDSKPGAHTVDKDFLTPEKRKALEAARAKYMPARLAAEKKAAEAEALEAVRRAADQVKADAQKKKAFEAQVELDRKSALQKAAEKQKPAKLVFSDVHDHVAKKPVLSQKPVFEKRPEKTKEEMKAYQAGWKEYDTHRRIQEYHRDADRRWERREREALESYVGMVHGELDAYQAQREKAEMLQAMKKPAATMVPGFGLWGDRRKAADQLKQKKVEAAMIDAALPKVGF